MQPPAPPLPELHLLRPQQITTPVRRHRDLVDPGEPGGDLGQRPVQRCAGVDRPRLLGGPGAELGVARPGAPVDRGLLGRGPLDRSAQVHLPAQRGPDEGGRGIGHRGQLGALRRVVVRVKSHTLGREPFTQYGSGRGPGHPVHHRDGRQHHRVGLGDVDRGGLLDPVAQQRFPATGQPRLVEIDVLARTGGHAAVVDAHGASEAGRSARGAELSRSRMGLTLLRGSSGIRFW
ncbi:Uncharacterised protein [Mycobacteroides abscessus subsp. abscessus]|nr:Uncharacterised protein [Mycobacteroides abscessus subsp. abscessus]